MPLCEKFLAARCSRPGCSSAHSRLFNICALARVQEGELGFFCRPAHATEGPDWTFELQKKVVCEHVCCTAASK